MAGFTGGRKPLGAAGIPPADPGPTVSATTNTGADTFYLLGLTLAEEIDPSSAAGPPVRATASGTNGTDTYYMLGMVLSETDTIGPASGILMVTEQGTVGSDTYYILGIVLSE